MHSVAAMWLGIGIISWTSRLFVFFKCFFFDPSSWQAKRQTILIPVLSNIALSFFVHMLLCTSLKLARHSQRKRRHVLFDYSAAFFSLPQISLWRAIPPAASRQFIHVRFAYCRLHNSFCDNGAFIATVNKHAKSCERDDGSMDGGASPVGGKIDYDRLGFLLNDSSMFKVYHFLTAHPRVKTPATWRPFMISRFPLWSLRVWVWNVMVLYSYLFIVLLHVCWVSFLCPLLQKCHTQEAAKCLSDRKRKFMDTELAQDTEGTYKTQTDYETAVNFLWVPG